MSIVDNALPGDGGRHIRDMVDTVFVGYCTDCCYIVTAVARKGYRSAEGTSDLTLVAIVAVVEMTVRQDTMGAICLHSELLHRLTSQNTDCLY